jgi:hypothetical protein
MEAARTVGNLGDLIALAQLTLQLIQAVTFAIRVEDGESRRKFQQLQPTLQQFGTALLMVCSSSPNNSPLVIYDR